MRPRTFSDAEDMLPSRVADPMKGKSVIPKSRPAWPLWLFLFVLFSVVVRALLPWAVGSTIEGVGGALLGRTISVEDVDLEVLAGRAHVRGLRVGTPLPMGDKAESNSTRLATPANDVLSIHTLVLDLDWLRVLALEICLARVEAAAPHLRVPLGPQGWPTPLVLDAHRPQWIRPWIARVEPWLRDLRTPVRVGRVGARDMRLELVTERGRFPGAIDILVRNFEIHALRVEAGQLDAETLTASDATVAVDVFDSRTEKSPVPPPTYPTVRLIEDFLAVEGDRIRVVSGHDILIEVRRAGEVLRARVDAVLNDLSYAAHHSTAVEADIVVGEGSLELAGRAMPLPPSYAGALRWQTLDIAALARFADLALPIDLERGDSDGAMQASLSVDVDSAIAAFELSGEAEVRGIDVRGETETFEARVRRMHLNAERLVGTVDWLGGGLGPLEADFERIEIDGPEARLDLPVLNLAQIDIAEWIPDDLEKLLATARIAVADARVDDGVIEAHDTRVNPPMNTKLSDVKVAVAGFDWPELDAERVHVSARASGGGGFDLAGSLERGAGEMSGVVSHMPLPGFSGYAVEISGFEIVDGQTSVDSNLVLGSERAALEGTLTLHRLDIEAEEGLFANVFGPPLEVGLALLSDDKGDIRVPVVLEYEYGTELSVWTIAWASLRAALQGGIGSSLGDVAGPDGRIPPQRFPPGEATLDDKTDDRLAKLAAALERHPDLIVAFVGHTAPSELPNAGAEEHKALATRRAAALRDGLVQRHGVDPQRVSARPGEESAPEASLELSLRR